MSVNSNGTETLTQSMNGIISFNDGSGTIIQNGTITTNTFNTTNLNVDNIQGIAPADNITLFTDTIGNIDLGGLTKTHILNVQAKDFVEINSSLLTRSIDIQSKSVNINNGTGTPTYIGL